MSQIFLGAPARPRPSEVYAADSGQLQLVDQFGRRARDLRVSVTDRCNLRCTYCMPQDHPQWMATERILTDSEVKRLLRIAVEMLGIQKIRFTGGEPLLRRSLEDLVMFAATLSTAEGARAHLALTTNGLGLDKRIGDLAKAGISRINISLDTLDEGRYKTLTGRSRLRAAQAGALAASQIPGLEVKINTVALPELFDGQEIKTLVDWSLEHGFQHRFIEHMPLGGALDWQRTVIVTQAQLLEKLEQYYHLNLISDPHDPAPARLWEASEIGGTRRGTVGIISSVSQPFCQNCDRTRLTADGQIRPCLFANLEVDLRSLLRSGASDMEIARAWAGATWEKPRAHGIDTADFVPTTRSMFEIGG